MGREVETVTGGRRFAGTDDSEDFIKINVIGAKNCSDAGLAARSRTRGKT